MRSRAWTWVLWVINHLSFPFLFMAQTLTVPSLPILLLLGILKSNLKVKSLELSLLFSLSFNFCLACRTHQGQSALAVPECQGRAMSGREWEIRGLLSEYDYNVCPLARACEESEKEIAYVFGMMSPLYHFLPLTHPFPWETELPSIVGWTVSLPPRP